VDLPMSPESQRVLNFATEEAGQREVTTAHVLLGLLRLPDCLATQMLNRHGLSFADSGRAC
jgi:hypothetical protein